MSAYNTEKLIEKAIKSVLEQTYPNIELIIIEDCSTDSTLEVIQKIIRENPGSDIKLIAHCKNLGAGWSRYDGIKASSGDYTTFLDSDDWLDRECIETLVKAAEETGADIVSPGFKTVDDKVTIRKPSKRIVVEGNDKFYMDSSDTCRFLNTNLIKATLWNEVKYSKRRFCEDSPTYIKLIAKAEKRCILDYAGYNYYQNSTSLIHISSPYKKEIYSILCLLDSVDVFGDMTIMHTLPYRLDRVSKLKSKEGISGDEIDEILNKLNNIVKRILVK